MNKIYSSVMLSNVVIVLLFVHYLVNIEIRLFLMELSVPDINFDKLGSLMYCYLTQRNKFSTLRNFLPFHATSVS